MLFMKNPFANLFKKKQKSDVPTPKPDAKKKKIASLVSF